MHANASAVFDAPTDPYGHLQPQTQKALAYWWMNRLVRLRRKWLYDGEHEVSEALEAECVDALHHLEQHLGTAIVEEVFQVIKSAQQRRNDRRQPPGPRREPRL